MAPPPVTYSAASFVGLAGTIVMIVLVGVIFLIGRRSRLRHREMQLTFFLIEILLWFSVIMFGIAV